MTIFNLCKSIGGPIGGVGTSGEGARRYSEGDKGTGWSSDAVLVILLKCVLLYSSEKLGVLLTSRKIVLLFFVFLTEKS